VLFDTILVEDSALVAIKVTGNNERCLVLGVNGPIFLPDLNQIYGFSTDFRKGLQYKISWKFVQWEMR